MVWRRHRHIPYEFAIVLEGLGFDGIPPDVFKEISEEAWTRTLALCDREHLTLPLYRRYGKALPERTARRIESNLAANEERVKRVQAAFQEISAKFFDTGIEWALLKGFTQYPDFVPDLRHRVQYDLDFFCPEDSIYRAREALGELGYEPLREMGAFRTDHLPVMIRKTGWQWGGDFFDPEIPVSVDLHFRFWDEDTEGFELPGIEGFWPRSYTRQIGELEVAGLHPADRLGYHCAHLLRHLLRSSLRLSHVYELAYFLDGQAADEAFWQEWQGLHPEALRRVQAITFRLAQSWFRCALAPAALEEIEQLPGEADVWFKHYAAAPVEKLFRPNKHELWLHLSLLESSAAKGKVIRRRLFPARLPGPVDSVYVPEDQMSARLRFRRTVRYTAHVVQRATHHVRVLPPAALHGALWYSRTRGFPKSFWTFIATASFFNLGLFVFVLIYNLYLLDRGFREDFLGLMNSAFTAGSVVGALPAGALLQRLGVAPTLRLCIGVTALISIARALLTGAAPLAASAFLGGAAFSLWAVTIAPTIAQLTTERTRPKAFSAFFGISIAVGVLGGLVGGQLPHWFAVTTPGLSTVQAKRAALLAGCGVMLLALLPSARLALPAEHVRSRPKYPFGPFMRRFLLSLTGWNLAVGAFNPFFNTFFARHLSASMAEIGIVFSTGQFAQVAAMLLAPIVLRKLGLVNGVMATQIATGLALAALASSSTIWLAAGAYAAYAAFQYMSEPGVYTLLMSRVRVEEQGGASSLNFLAAFSAHAISATLAGAALARFGYPPVVATIALMAIVSGLLFRALLRGFETGARATE